MHCFVGMEHTLQFTNCGCEPLPVTLARADLWPATPCSPRFCFSFGLLDWAEALMLESHVSLKDFCNTLKLRCPFQIHKVSVQNCQDFMEVATAHCVFRSGSCIHHLSILLKSTGDF